MSDPLAARFGWALPLPGLFLTVGCELWGHEWRAIICSCLVTAMFVFGWAIGRFYRG